MGKKVEVIDLEKKYGFKIIYRDEAQYLKITTFSKKYLVYYVIENNELYYVTTNKSLRITDDICDFGLDIFSGHGIDYLEKDYQIAYHDERDKCVFTEELFKKFCDSGEYSINTENKIKLFFRKRKIQSVLKDIPKN